VLGMAAVGADVHRHVLHHAEHLFGEGGGEKLAAQFGVELLASMPLSACRTSASATTEALGQPSATAAFALGRRPRQDSRSFFAAFDRTPS
ncbi:hypothetical protein ACV36M_32865, partial [Pseudomonas aeruginosa]